jgi:hypothetical protein
VKNLTWRLYLCIFCTHTLAPLLSSLPQLTSVVRFTSTTTLEQEQHPPHSVLFKTIIGSISTSLPPPPSPPSPLTLILRPITQDKQPTQDKQNKPVHFKKSTSKKVDLAACCLLATNSQG